MVMRASDPRQGQMPPGVTLLLVVVFGPFLLVLAVGLIRIVFEFLRIVLS